MLFISSQKLIPFSRYFILTFWLCRKKCLIRKIRLISEVMTLQQVMVNKQLQYTYCPTSHEVKAIMKFGNIV